MRTANIADILMTPPPADAHLAGNNGHDDGQPVPEIIRPAFLSIAQLCTRFPAQREPIIDGILRRGEVGNLVSAPKMFKSWTLMHLALSVITGQPWFGFTTLAGKVAMLDYELAPGTIAKRLQAVLLAMALSPEEIGDRLSIEPLRGRRLNVHALGGYFSEIEARQFDLIVIDPLYRAFPRDLDENSNADMAEVYATLQAYAERLDTAMIVVHHLTKGDQSVKSITDLGAGGGSQARAADAHLAIRPHAENDAAVLTGVVRSFAPFDPFCIQWRYPLWYMAPELDPADLRKPPRRNAAPKKDEAPAEPPPPPWTVDRFVEASVTAEPRARAGIIATAIEAGVSNRKAEELLKQAEGTGKVFRWRQPKDARAFFATVPPMSLISENPK